MNRRHALLTIPLAALCVALGACAQSKPPGPPPGLDAARCPPGNCEIKVFVENCSAPGGIRLDKPLVEVTSAVNMRWTIVTPGFVFETNGVQFDPSNPQFELRNNPHPNEFHIHNKRSQAGDFYYFVNVRGCRQMDPWVRNL
jgi:hypothetical protein